MVSRQDVARARETLVSLNKRLHEVTDAVCKEHGVVVSDLRELAREKVIAIVNEIAKRTGELVIEIGGQRWCHESVAMCWLGTAIDSVRFTSDTRGDCERILHEAQYYGTDEDRRARRRREEDDDDRQRKWGSSLY